ncbi:MAG: flagellar M-ring protein FliF, partial [Firmicutes bacterium]|nr:flagellar M-ring protein FliF [Bacillota bacterium]
MTEKKNFPIKLASLQGKWQQLSRAKKIAAIVICAAVICVFIFAGKALLKPRFSPLFTGLEPVSAGKITAKLQELGIPYELDNQGQTILVQEDKVYDLRIQLASDGTLAEGSAGFELFDQTKLGATDFERHLNYQRALQEELRRTIVRLEAVEQARVHLTLPEPSVFITETAAPSASIVLKLNPFTQLEQNQIRGIMQLVAGSVENLLPEAITIIDTHGNLLSDFDDVDYSAQIADATLKQLEVRRAFEKELEQRVQRLLDKVLGPGQAIAMMTAELDFNSQESTVISYAEDGVPRSQTVKRETWVGSGAIGGEAGTDSNIPGYVLPEDSENGAYEKVEETTNYEISETTQKQIMAPGRLLKLHTAVVVNDKNGTITPQQVAQIRNTVAAAVGYQPERGDQIDVQGMNFNTEAQEAAEKEMRQARQRERLEQYIRNGALGLAGFLILLVISRILGKRRERMLDAELAELPTLPDGGAEALMYAEINEEADDESSLNQQVRKVAEKEPEMAAFLIRTWLAEE